MQKSVKRKEWVKVKGPLTRLIHTHVTCNQRYELQKRVLREWRIYDTVTVRLLQVILSPATSYLRLVQVRAFYRDDVTSLLLQLGGLRLLSIQDLSWTSRSNNALQLHTMSLSLAGMQHLRILVMQYCAHDILLAVVAESCHHLQVVDLISRFPGLERV
ncbi:hypothetical protein Pmani_018929 [Petrolisthes manimaculis]|uniref:Uncharacterized protein n=1 Tax=Petrolisthes manimaculis TaxID=1843537 RepID=A0AAE1PLQ3_9EUCA|nr:hypothetical protein Pmani_018929 [Petrolisthes manimaculis]